MRLTRVDLVDITRVYFTQVAGCGAGEILSKVAPASGHFEL